MNDEHTNEATTTASDTIPAPPPKRKSGFASMDRSLVQAIARKGGVAAHAKGTAHEFTTEEARAAGQKGGRACHARKRAKNGG